MKRSIKTMIAIIKTFPACGPVAISVPTNNTMAARI